MFVQPDIQLIDKHVARMDNDDLGLDLIQS